MVSRRTCPTNRKRSSNNCYRSRCLHLNFSCGLVVDVMRRFDFLLSHRHQSELESLQARHLEEISLFKRKLSMRSDIGPVNSLEMSGQHQHTRSSSVPQTIQQVYYAPVLYQDLSPVHGKKSCNFGLGK